ncbi:MAG: hypothetical protein Q9227_003220 [Pyrenula ochraceoflavens]
MALGKRARATVEPHEGKSNSIHAIPKAVAHSSSEIAFASRKRRARTPIIHQDDQDASLSRASRATLKSSKPDGPTNGCQIHSQRSSTTKQVVRNGRPVLSSTKANIQKKPDHDYGSDVLRQSEQLETPKSLRFKDVLSENTPTTPKHRIRVGAKAFSTPSTIRTSVTPTSRSQSVYSAPRQLFSQGSTPDRLIGREDERQQLHAFVTDAVSKNRGGCLYISGPPGTGKSAIVEEVLQNNSSNESLKISNVNCVSMKSAKDVFAKLVQDFCANKTSVNTAEKALSSLFIPKKASDTVYLVMLDEIDHLLATDLEALYSLFEWSLGPKSQLLLLGIANALDLTDRFLPRLKARNLKPQLLSFRPYTAPQIASIITTRLQSLIPAGSDTAPTYTPFLHPAAIQLCSKKVASQTGDLRKAFEIVRRAIDRIERETLSKEAQDQSPIPKTTALPSPPSSSPLKPPTPTQTPHHHKSSLLSHLTPSTAPRATISHLASITSSIFNSSGTAPRLSSLNLQQKAALCTLLSAEKKRTRRINDPFSTPTKSGKAPTANELWGVYVGLCKNGDGMLHPLTATEFRDVVASLEGLGLVGEVKGGFTPSRMGRGRGGGGIGGEGVGLSSLVSEREMVDVLEKGGAEKGMLRGLLMGEA